MRLALVLVPMVIAAAPVEKFLSVQNNQWRELWWVRHKDGGSGDACFRKADGGEWCVDVQALPEHCHE